MAGLPIWRLKGEVMNSPSVSSLAPVSVFVSVQEEREEVVRGASTDATVSYRRHTKQHFLLQTFFVYTAFLSLAAAQLDLHAQKCNVKRVKICLEFNFVQSVGMHA